MGDKRLQVREIRKVFHTCKISEANKGTFGHFVLQPIRTPGSDTSSQWEKRILIWPRAFFSGGWSQSLHSLQFHLQWNNFGGMTTQTDIKVSCQTFTLLWTFLIEKAYHANNLMHEHLNWIVVQCGGPELYCCPVRWSWTVCIVVQCGGPELYCCPVRGSRRPDLRVLRLLGPRHHRPQRDAVQLCGEECGHSWLCRHRPAGPTHSGQSLPSRRRQRWVKS